MMKIKLSVLAIIALVGLISAKHSNATELSEPAESVSKLSTLLSTIEVPEPILRTHPKYPRNAAMNQREGWAKLSFVIDEQGDVSNVIVMETSGSKDFAKAASNAVKKWKYKPAFENGKPIQQCVNTVQMDFKMAQGGQNKVSRRFYSRYKKGLKALEEKDFQQLDALLESMSSQKKMHLSESNYFRVLSADYAKVLADKESELYHLDRISFIGDFKEGVGKLTVLNRLFQLEVGLSHFKRAHETYQRLTKLDVAKPYMASYNAVMAKIEQAIQSNDELLFSATVNNDGLWSHGLVRNDFSITDIKGSLDNLDVRCANKRHVFTIGEKTTWKVPQAWQNCSLFVSGDAETEFTLVEYPLANNSI